MNKKVGIRFKSGGKVYDFECTEFDLEMGDPVIVDTEKGLGFGTVAVLPTEYDADALEKPLKGIFRKSTPEDFAQVEKNIEIEKRAHAFCSSIIREMNLEMNLFSVESTFDASRLTFFFTADGRVDFRNLVKILVKEFRTRIEMRQVGIRNQAKMCGGVGRCGRVLCCSTFLEKFDPISIRMAKEQGLSLNPTKISGQCGRLMCCLTYENETYISLKRDFPKIGTTVKTKEHSGKVLRYNVICNRLTIKTLQGEEEQEIEIKLSDIIPESSKTGEIHE